MCSTSLLLRIIQNYALEQFDEIILWKLYDGNIVFNLWLLSGKLWYYGMVSYYSFKAMAPGAGDSHPSNADLSRPR